MTNDITLVRSRSVEHCSTDFRMESSVFNSGAFSACLRTSETEIIMNNNCLYSPPRPKM